MKKMFIGLVLLFVLNSAFANKDGLRFNDNGEMVYPDDYLVYHALKDDAKGHKNDAEWKLKRASRYGNKDAQYLMGLLYLQKNQEIEGYAWLMLAGSEVGQSKQLIKKLEAKFTENEISQAQKHLAELKVEYNFTNAIKFRHQWARSNYHAGSHIGGYVAPMVDIDPGHTDGKIINGHKVKNNYDGFVYNYRYDQGEVIIKDLELIDSE